MSARPRPAPRTWPLIVVLASIGALVTIGCVRGLPYLYANCESDADCPAGSGFTCLLVPGNNVKKCEFVCSEVRDCPPGAGACEPITEELQICVYEEPTGN